MPKVKVARFPKRCPHCDRLLEVVRKISGAWWYECKDSGDIVKCFPHSRFMKLEPWIYDLLKEPNSGVAKII